MKKENVNTEIAFVSHLILPTGPKERTIDYFAVAYTSVGVTLRNSGITYLIQDNFQLDASYGTGLNNNMNYFALGLGINISKQKPQ
ncbi:MAG: hypothetical protein L3J25_04595 [Flavobacteriaceae bacterium]|nr:hypothetical protein [Flavobacteriaceae bacterium]